MEQKRKSAAAPSLAVLAIVLVTLGVYVGGYFWLPQTEKGVADNPGHDDYGQHFVIRIYSAYWQADLFYPARVVEAWWLGGEVHLYPIRHQKLP